MRPLRKLLSPDPHPVDIVNNWAVKGAMRVARSHPLTARTIGTETAEARLRVAMRLYSVFGTLKYIPIGIGALIALNGGEPQKNSVPENPSPQEEQQREPLINIHRGRSRQRISENGTTELI